MTQQNQSENGSSDDPQLQAMLNGMHRFYTPLVSDTMERLGMRSGALHHSIQAVISNPSMKVCGLAFPCRVVPTHEYVEIDRLLEMVDSIPENAFVIVSADSDIDAALWGGLMSARARARGAVGAAVNGGVRDIEQIAELGFPVFGTYRCITDIRRRGFMAKYNVPVFTGGQTIVPGDIIFGDANGVLVIARERFERVYRELDIAHDEESRTHASLVKGTDAREVFEKFGRF
ncbi:MAG: RraA family protein [bacterium]|nr:RraA family protein [Candidatus Kapabacteria bacterium]